MVTVLLGGLLGRQKRGPGRIGLESTVVLILYIAVMAVLALPDSVLG